MREKSYGLSKGDTRTVGVEVRKKPKDLSPSDIEECGHGKGVGVCMLLWCRQIYIGVG